RRLPVGPAMFPPDMVTDRAEEFLAGELIREQLYLQLGQELPYATAVVIERFEERDAGDLGIDAYIAVERDSQKPIVIGRVGGRPALVHDTPGLTRDRRYGELDYFGRELELIDTGGLDPAAEADVIGAGIHRQAWRAIEEADALLLVVDGSAGLAPADAEVA